MARTELDLNPVEFITIGTIGPKGNRTFHLQAGHDGKIVSFVIEKEQARSLSEHISDLIAKRDEEAGAETTVQMASLDMDLREPITPMFRIAQMALSLEQPTDVIVLEVHEFMTGDSNSEDAGVVRMWCSVEQAYALSIQAMDTVEAGRPSPRQNGQITYYWT